MENRVIIAAAGAGKTTALVKKALEICHYRKILITTYTDNNCEEIRKRFYEKLGFIPKNIEILPWYTFLLVHLIRPFQGCLWEKRISNLILINGTSTTGISKTNTKRYYFNNEGKIYSDKMSQFAIECNNKTKGQVLFRLSQIYSDIYIDEVQDLAGWDLEVIHKLFETDINTLFVGDPRQSTLHTNNSRKNKGNINENLISWFIKEQKKIKTLVIDNESLNINHRCSKSISSLSDKLYPEYPSVRCDNEDSKNHGGIFLVNKDRVNDYLREFNPMQLQYNISAKTNSNYSVMNIGKAKGLKFNRVLIYPTKNFINWITTGFNKIKIASETKCKFYVAITRAQISVAFVCEKELLKDSSSYYEQIHVS